MGQSLGKLCRISPFRRNVAYGRVQTHKRPVITPAFARVSDVVLDGANPCSASRVADFSVFDRIFNAARSRCHPQSARPVEKLWISPTPPPPPAKPRRPQRRDRARLRRSALPCPSTTTCAGQARTGTGGAKGQGKREKTGTTGSPGEPPEEPHRVQHRNRRRAFRDGGYQLSLNQRTTRRMEPPAIRSTGASKSHHSS